MTVIANGYHGWNRNGPWLILERVWRSAMHSDTVHASCSSGGRCLGTHKLEIDCTLEYHCQTTTRPRVRDGFFRLTVFTDESQKAADKQFQK
jgi:hypothetical protein